MEDKGVAKNIEGIRTNAAIHGFVEIDGDDGVNLEPHRPEDTNSGKKRDVGEDVAAVVGIDFGVKQQAGEVGEGGEDDNAKQDAGEIAQLQFVKMYRSDDAEDDRDGDRDGDFALAGGQRQRCP